MATNRKFDRSNYAYNKMMEKYVNLMDIILHGRFDMHEPDEQSILARVVGTSFDNACGEQMDADAIRDGYQEIVVCVDRYDTLGHQRVDINLATLMAIVKNMFNFTNGVVDNSWKYYGDVATKRCGPLHVAMIRRVKYQTIVGDKIQWTLFLNGELKTLEASHTDENAAEAEADNLIMNAMTNHIANCQEAMKKMVK
jgi:hypothetical protein